MSLPKKISKQLGGKVLTVVVGSGKAKHEFVVHEEIICESSDFFRNAMKRDWKEKEHRKVLLSDQDPDVFAVYLQASYNGHVHLDPKDPHYALGVWAAVFILADQLMDADVKDIVLKTFYKIRHNLWKTCITTGQAVKTIYDGTPGPCGLRQLFVDSAVYYYKCPQSDKADFATAMQNAPREFLEDVVVTTVSRKSDIKVREPPCSCPDTYAFFDYYDRYVDAKEDTSGGGGKASDKCSHDDDCCHCCDHSFEESDSVDGWGASAGADAWGWGTG